MTRIKDGPDLFGGGIGISTAGEFTCCICGRTYNKGADETEDYGDETTCYTDFAGQQVCEYCFEVVEKEILSRMSVIIPWYKEYIDGIERQLAKARAQLASLE